MSSTVETPLVTWNYLPVTHVHRLDGSVSLTLIDDQQDGPVRLRVTDGNELDLLSPYLHLFRLEQMDPWANGPAYLPVRRTTAGLWAFSPEGARHDASLLAKPDPFRKLATLTSDSELARDGDVHNFFVNTQISTVDSPTRS